MTLPSSRSPRRWLGAFAAAAVSAACGACVFVPLPAEATVVRTGSAVASERPLAVTVLVNPDDDRTTRSLGRQMVDCITRRLSETTPVVGVAQLKEFYHSLFQPLLVAGAGLHRVAEPSPYGQDRTQTGAPSWGSAQSLDMGHYRQNACTQCHDRVTSSASCPSRSAIASIPTRHLVCSLVHSREANADQCSPHEGRRGQGPEA